MLAAVVIIGVALGVGLAVGLPKKGEPMGSSYGRLSQCDACVPNQGILLARPASSASCGRMLLD